MNINIRFLIAGVVLFFAFIFFSYLVDINIFKQTDFNLTVRLQDNIPRRLDDFFSLFSDMGSFEVLVVVLIVLLVAMRKIIAGVVTLFLFGLFHLIEIFGKTTVENLPPPQFMLRTKHLVEFPQFHVRSEFSYPSGHSGRTMFISILLIAFIWYTVKLPIPLKVVLIGGIVAFDIIMLTSRVYLGEHWTTDIIGGLLLGSAFALMSTSLFFSKKHTKNNGS